MSDNGNNDHVRHLNFNHLRCFWSVAKEGSVTRAGRLLGLTQPTISKQISDLEDSVGEPLFDRVGRRLVLTNLGRTVYAYADDIFSLGQELMDSVRGHVTGRPARLHVGVSDMVPKSLTRLVLEPALGGEAPARLVCREGKTDHLLADLAISGLDVVITDAPLPPHARVRAFNHLLGKSPVGVYGVAELAGKYRDDFPQSLDGAPMLLPTEDAVLRRSIDEWLAKRGVTPLIVAEFDDTALLKAFAEGGHGLFFAPTAVHVQLETQFRARLVGPVDDVAEHLYAVTIERRIVHPGIVSIVEGARERLEAAGRT